MSDLIDRQAAIDAVKAFLHNDDDWFQEAAAAEIKKLPTIDAVQVVRCKDCIYHKDDNVGHWCEHTLVTFEGFCKSGKRRTDEQA